jgi:sugar lactone lactonase YvrE
MLHNSLPRMRAPPGAERIVMNTRTLLSSGLLSLAIACGSTGSTGPADVEQLPLPGDSYYPESLNVGADGALYVGSLASGQVVKFAPGSTAAQVLVPPGTVKAVAGVLVDDAAAALYLCTDDTSAQNPAPPVVRSFRTSDGAPLGSYPFPAGGFCNDLAFDGKRNLYVTDSSGKIYRLPSGGSALALWSSDPALAPPTPQGFGADGIVWDGKDGLYVNTFSSSTLLRFPINADGSAGTPSPIRVSPALSSPDGMRLLDASTLLVVEGAGRLTRVAVSGTTATATVLKDGLNSPTSVAHYGGYGWVAEGQLGHFLGLISGPPNTPFLVRRVALP